MTQEQFVKAINYLCSVYKNYDGSQFGLTADEMNVWYKMLGQTELRVFQFAAREHMLNISKPPTIASLNQMIKQAMEQAIEIVNVDEQADFIIYKATKRFSPTYNPEKWKQCIEARYGQAVREIAETFMQDIKMSNDSNVGHIRFNLKKSLETFHARKTNEQHLALTNTNYAALEDKFNEMRIGLQMEGIAYDGFTTDA